MLIFLIIILNSLLFAILLIGRFLFFVLLVNNEIHLQKNFVCSENGEVLVDFIGRYENIQNDFEKICKTIGIEKIKLPHTNISNHKPFMDYYNEKTKKMVYDAFGEDFKMFNYE